jgi:hypothetical protein
METIDPFWWAAALLSAFSGGVCLVLTLMAAVYWLIWGTRGGRILFLALLTCTALAAVAFGAAAFLSSK